MVLARRTHLRDSPTSFVGRARESSVLAAALERSKLVTLSGAPGTGKTRLALEHASRRVDDYPGGVSWVDLTEANEARDLHAVFARALDLSIASVTDEAGAVALIATSLRARGRTLVVLDELEKVVAVARDSVRWWMEASRETSWLVTTREALRIPGEEVIELGPFDAEGSDGVELFMERARQVWPRYRPGAEDRAAIAALVRELDGLPLAIELAAARIRTHPPRRWLERRSARNLETLGDAIRSSWDTLEVSEKRAMVACALFRGGFSWQAAEALLDVEAMRALVDKSLLVSSKGRLSMLSSIREFAVERSREDPSLGEDEQLERQRRWYCAEGERRRDACEGSDAEEAERWLGLELDNLLAIHRRALATTPIAVDDARDALRVAVVLAPWFLQHGPCGTYLELVDAALEVAKRFPLEPSLLLAARLERAVTLDNLGRSAEARATLEEGLEQARVGSDRRMEGRFVAQLGHHWLARDLDRSRALFDEALPLLREVDDRFALGRTLVFASLVHCHRREPERSRQSREEGIAVLRAIGHRFMLGLGHTFGGVLELQMGRLPEARAFLEEALELHGTKGDRLEGYALGVLAVVRQEQGALEEARTLYERAIRIHCATGSTRHERGDRIFLANCLQERGDLAGARRSLEEARAAGAADDRLEVLALACLATLDATEDALANAEDRMGQAEAKLARLGASSPYAFPIAVHRGHLDLARARRARAEGDRMATEQHRAAAHDRLAAGEREAQGSDEGRFALRMLRRAVDDHDVPTRRAPSAPGGEDALLVAENGRWFRPPHGSTVDLGGRSHLRNMLQALVQRRLERPGRSLSVLDLAGRGWPDQNVDTQRVYTTIARLRKLGLGDLLMRRDDGYLLDPTVALLRGEKGRVGRD